MNILEIVNRLEHCKSTGKDSYIARCPSHDDSSPSLTIKELPDGRILLHCFAGCGALDVLQSIGLDWDALFPPDLDNYSRPRRIRATETVDSLVIEIAEHDRAMGKRLNKAGVERYRAALRRQPPRSDAIVEIAYEMGAISLENK